MSYEHTPYTDYKDSNETWLGRVPAHWDIVPLARIGRFFKGNGGSKIDEVTDGVPCIRYGDLYTQKETFISASRSFVTPERSADYTPVQSGDILFAGSGETLDEIGKSAVCLIVGDACCGGDVLILRPSSEMNPRFLGYALESPQAIHQKACMGRGVTIMHIYISSLKYLRLAIPPEGEQASIVRYLDYMERRIRRYSRSKLQLISLLREEKQMIIQSAVTRGINSNADLKASGVAWLGDLPSHWDIVRLGTVLRERGETNDELRVTEVLSVLRERGVIPYAEKGNVGNKKSDDITRYKIVRPNDIVVNSMNVIIGSVGLSQYEGCLSPVYYVLTRRNEYDDPRYLNAYFQTKLFQRSLVRIGYGILPHRMRIPMSLLKCEPFPRPPASEQRDIVRYIDGATARVEAAIEHAQRQVSMIKEYRSRLIADVVTGKLDVREIAAKLPEENIPEEVFLEGEELFAEDVPEEDDSGLEASLEELDA